MNMGAWSFVRDYLEKSMVSAKTDKESPLYIGRSPSASPATGTLKRHLMEQKDIIENALKVATKHQNAAAE